MSIEKEMLKLSQSIKVKLLNLDEKDPDYRSLYELDKSFDKHFKFMENLEKKKKAFYKKIGKA